MIKFALFIAACACALASKPRCFCPIEYNPVCGTDGRTYLSECILTCALQRGKGNVVGKQGPCDPPPCTCPTDYNPVCGSNGVTYGNDCLLNCASADDSTLSIARKGSCDHTVAIVDQPTCQCPDDFKPVCGADGVTYTSECLLKCAEQKVAKVGPCEPTCACPNVKKQVCGSNGITYDNTCWLNCATKDDSSLSIAGVGPCEQSLPEGVILIVEQPGCRACRSDSKPVCGKDRNTYSNECVLECAGVELLKEGACEPPCTCPAEKSPVCGTDNVTYGNVCLLNCATLDDSSLRVARSGACGSDDGGAGGVKVVEQSDCTCTRNFKPVCGTDGVTYNNECLLGCAGQTLAKVGSCEPTTACTCPKEGKAVCGTNGRTYANVCLLNCATKDDSTLGVNHPGFCKTSHIDVRKS